LKLETEQDALAEFGASPRPPGLGFVEAFEIVPVDDAGRAVTEASGPRLR